MGKLREKIKRLTDVGEWGEKDQRGAYASPLNIAGERVDLDSTPPLSPVDGGKRNAPLAKPGTL